jgi:hypothetical protein
MVGVAQDDLCINHGFQLLLGNALHAAGRAHGHEHGSLKKSVICYDGAGAGGGLGIGMLQLEL